jgi:hypothetical protein
MVKHLPWWRLPSWPKCMLIGVRWANLQEDLSNRARWRRRVRCPSNFHAVGPNTINAELYFTMAWPAAVVRKVGRWAAEIGRAWSWDRGVPQQLDDVISSRDHISSQLLVHTPRTSLVNAW